MLNVGGLSHEWNTPAMLTAIARREKVEQEIKVKPCCLVLIGKHRRNMLAFSSLSKEKQFT